MSLLVTVHIQCPHMLTNALNIYSLHIYGQAAHAHAPSAHEVAFLSKAFLECMSVKPVRCAHDLFSSPQLRWPDPLGQQLLAASAGDPDLWHC